MPSDRPTSDSSTIAVLRGEVERLRTLLTTYIVDREAAEEALRTSEERYRSLFERAAFGIYRSTPEGRFLDANPALVRMLGYESLAELQALDIGRDVYRNPDARAELFALAEHTEPQPWIDAEWRRKDGSPISVRLSARLVRDARGAIRYCESIAEDVTERQRREELIRRHERLAALGTTLAGVAHELNNPLAAIKGFTQLLLSGRGSMDERSALETIHRETERAAKIVRDLLVFARRQESQRREVIDLNEVVRYVLSTRQYAMETRGIECRAELSADPVCVLGDGVQLEQVVLNLVLNAEQALAAECDAPASAVEARHPRGLIVVRTRVADGLSLLDVRDNGPGVLESDLVRIWDPFWTTKREGEGTGLGLSVVHGIVTAHGGSVEAESDAGDGMRVSVRFPSADDAAISLTAQLSRAPAPDETSGGQAHIPLDILLVDDEASILEFLKEFLESRGHAVLCAHSGEQALRLAELARFDVVVCDLRMPGLGGDEVIQRLRRMPGFERARYLISTGDNASTTAARRIAALRPDAVLSKPYEMEQLRRVVETCAPSPPSAMMESMPAVATPLARDGGR